MQFTDENGQRQHVWQTSWAISTRFIGGIIMTHGDDAGLMLPPNVAPIQVFVDSYYRINKLIYSVILLQAQHLKVILFNQCAVLVQISNSHFP